MDMNNLRVESHVAQKNRRHKLRFQQNSGHLNNHHHQDHPQGDVIHRPFSFNHHISPSEMFPSHGIVMSHHHDDHFQDSFQYPQDCNFWKTVVSSQQEVSNDHWNNNNPAVSYISNSGYGNYHQDPFYNHNALQVQDHVTLAIPPKSKNDLATNSSIPCWMNGSDESGFLANRGSDQREQTTMAVKEGLSLSLSSVPHLKDEQPSLQPGQNFRKSELLLNPDPKSLMGVSAFGHRNTGPLGPFTGYATVLKNSKYIKPAQELLNRSCEVGDHHDGYSHKVLEEEMSRASDYPVGSYGETDERVSGRSSSGTGSVRPEFHRKKARLLYMQEEVCRRYKQYLQQMQMVISSFETVAGLSAAAPYVCLALKVVSRHFHHVKNVISEQLSLTRKTVGEGLCSSSKIAFDANVTSSSGVKSGGGGSGFFGPHQQVWRPQRGLPERAIAVLKTWLFDHFLHPYPSDADKHMLATQTGLTRNQVSNWFINARVRIWKPMVEEIHALETKSLQAELNSSHPQPPDGQDPGSWNMDMSSLSNTQPPECSRNPGVNINITADKPSCTQLSDNDHEKQAAARPEYQNLPLSGMDRLMTIMPYPRATFDATGLGPVSLTLGLRQNAEHVQQLQQHFGGQLIHDFVALMMVSHKVKDEENIKSKKKTATPVASASPASSSRRSSRETSSGKPKNESLIKENIISTRKSERLGNRKPSGTTPVKGKPEKTHDRNIATPTKKSDRISAANLKSRSPVSPDTSSMKSKKEKAVNGGRNRKRKRVDTSVNKGLSKPLRVRTEEGDDNDKESEGKSSEATSSSNSCREVEEPDSIKSGEDKDDSDDDCGDSNGEESTVKASESQNMASDQNEALNDKVIDLEQDRTPCEATAVAETVDKDNGVSRTDTNICIACKKLRCYHLPLVAESIWDTREVEVAEAQGLQKQKQYFVKYKGLAHIHNQWIPETQLLLEAPLLVENYSKNGSIKWNKEWTKPKQLLNKRLLLSIKPVCESQENAVKVLHYHYEWLVQWQGLDYDQATWESENIPFLDSPESRNLHKDYEEHHASSDNDRIEEIPIKLPPGMDNIHSSYVKNLHDAWTKGPNSIVFDDQERTARIVLFILSLKSISLPFLLITRSDSLSQWEAMFYKIATSNAYKVSFENTHENTSSKLLHVQKEDGQLAFQLLLCSVDDFVKDLNLLTAIKWEAVIVDESQSSDISSHFRHIMSLSTDKRLLVFCGTLGVINLDVMQLLDCGVVTTTELGDISKLKETLSKLIAYECKSNSSKFVEYWVPVQISNVQLEQYCSMLLSNTMALSACSKSDSTGALHDILVSNRKCCDHPYIVDQSLQAVLTKDLELAKILDVGIKASGKLQFLDRILPEMRKRQLRVLIVFQPLSGSGKDSTSIGDILDDFVRQRFGVDSYERVDGIGMIPSKKQAALSNFNNKEMGRFIFLLEYRACHPSIKLSSIDTIIIFDSDWNPANDLRALQRIAIDSPLEQIMVFRLYTSLTLEEKILRLAEHNVTIDSRLQNISRSTSDKLLMWGATYLFKKLDEFHSDLNTSSEECWLNELMKEFSDLISNKCKNKDAGKLKITRARPICGKNATLPNDLDGVQPHTFWRKLLAGRDPCWKYLSTSTPRQRTIKRPQYFEVSPKRTNANSDDAGRKRKKIANNITEPVASKPVLDEGEITNNIIDPVASKPVIEEGENINNVIDPVASKPVIEEGDMSFQDILKLKISKLCEVLKLSEDVKIMVERFLEYVIENYRVNKEPENTLHAFLISLCWIGSGLLKHKLDRKQSISLANEHLDFGCNEEEANTVYLKLELAKEMFLLHTDNQKKNCVTANAIPEVKIEISDSPSNHDDDDDDVDTGVPTDLVNEFNSEASLLQPDDEPCLPSDNQSNTHHGEQQSDSPNPLVLESSAPVSNHGVTPSESIQLNGEQSGNSNQGAPRKKSCDPLQAELERLCDLNNTVIKFHETVVSFLFDFPQIASRSFYLLPFNHMLPGVFLQKQKIKSDHEKELADIIAQVNARYEARNQSAEAAYQLRKKEIDTYFKRVVMNKVLAETFKSKCQDLSPISPSETEGGTHHPPQFCTQGGSNGVTFSSSRSQQVTGLQPPLQIVDQSSKLFSTTPTIPPSNDTNPATMPIRPPPSNSIRPPPSESVRPPTSTAVPSITPNKPPFTASIPSRPLPGINPSSRPINPIFPTSRPPSNIFPSAPSARNPRVNEIRAPAPHIRPFRPSTSTSPHEHRAMPSQMPTLMMVSHKVKDEENIKSKKKTATPVASASPASSSRRSSRETSSGKPKNESLIKENIISTRKSERLGNRKPSGTTPVKGKPEKTHDRNITTPTKKSDRISAANLKSRSPVSPDTSSMKSKKEKAVNGGRNRKRKRVDTSVNKGLSKPLRVRTEEGDDNDKESEGKSSEATSSSNSCREVEEPDSIKSGEDKDDSDDDCGDSNGEESTVKASESQNMASDQNEALNDKVIDLEQIKWSKEWTMPKQLLNKRLLLSIKPVCEGQENAVKVLHYHYEWLVQWQGLDYDQATWESENIPFLDSPESRNLHKDYEEHHASSDNDRIEEIPIKLPPGMDNIHSSYVKNLHDAWTKGPNSIVFDDQKEDGQLAFQLLLCSVDDFVKDLNLLTAIKWEAVIVDESQSSDISSHFRHIMSLSTDKRLLVFCGTLGVINLDVMQLLDCGVVTTTELGDISKLKETLSKLIAYECKSNSSKFVEYWVPVQISNVQLEQYCSMLLSNTMALSACSKSDSTGALHDILVSNRKCCDHPYIVDQSLQAVLTKDLELAKILDVGIKASGKLQFLDRILPEMRKRQLRVLIVFQPLSGSGKDSTSIGDILDDFVRQRFGVDSYERVDGIGMIPSKKQAALSNFNNKEMGRFIFLLEYRACHPSIKLSSIDTIIIFDSDWNPANDLRALQRIAIDSPLEQIMVFRLYTSLTLEEKILRLAEHNVTIDSRLQNISRSTSDKLLMWGATYLFKKLDEFHSDLNTSSEECWLNELMKEFSDLISNKCKNKDAGKLKITRARPICGKNATLPNDLDGVQPHTFWRKLLAGRDPCWKYLSTSTPRQRTIKRPQYFEVSPKRTNANSDDAGRKRKKIANNITEPVASKPVLDEGEITNNIIDPVASKPVIEEGDMSFQDILKLKISKLCEVLKLSEDVKIMVERFLEYVIENYRVNKEPENTLHAFLISLCWIGSGLLKHKLDRKQSISLANEHLDFGCNEEEANTVYLKLELAKEMFLLHTDNQKKNFVTANAIPEVKIEISDSPSNHDDDDDVDSGGRCNQKDGTNNPVTSNALEKNNNNNLVQPLVFPSSGQSVPTDFVNEFNLEASLLQPDDEPCLPSDNQSNTHHGEQQSDSPNPLVLESSAPVSNHGVTPSGSIHLNGGQSGNSNQGAPQKKSCDPLQAELERLCDLNNTVVKFHETVKQKIKSDHEKELADIIAQVNAKYEARNQSAEAAYQLRKKEIDTYFKRVVMNKVLAETFKSKCQDLSPISPSETEGGTHHPPQFRTQGGSNGVTFSSSRSQQVTGLQPPLQIVDQSSKLFSSTPTIPPSNDTNPATMPIRPPPSNSIRPPPTESVRPPTSTAVPSITPNKPPFTASIPSRPLPGINPSSRPINPIFPTSRPPSNIFPSAPSARNPRVNEIRAPAPHIRPFRPSTSTSPHEHRAMPSQRLSSSSPPLSQTSARPVSLQTPPPFPTNHSSPRSSPLTSSQPSSPASFQLPSLYPWYPSVTRPAKPSSHHQVSQLPPMPSVSISHTGLYNPTPTPNLPMDIDKPELLDLFEFGKEGGGSDVVCLSDDDVDD
ncbi:hypothetical protein SSX86_018739 [Deinandra increscens subsp. villosa]|uniref:Uncharacterized protein n=1 Tax=Deinandra increscens subsp. villosa TaxID=3103831 RepID=A0AAP0GV17_9ASTR